MGRVGGLQTDICASRVDCRQEQRFVGQLKAVRALANLLAPTGEKMEIHLNITFPRIPCELLTLDVMDVSGEQQVGVMHGVNKVRLASEAEGGGALDINTLDL